MNVIRFFAIFLSFYLIAQKGFSQQKTKKTLFVIVDGIAADVLERVNTPYIDLISRDGVYTRAFLGGEKGGYTETPTISAVGYNSLLTGTWANKHNVWDNDIQSPNYHYWTIFRYLKEQYPKKKAAVFSTWLDNRTKLIGDGLTLTGGWKVDHHFDGLELDTINFPHQDELYIQKIDEKVALQAAMTIQKEGPDFNWVYLQFTDNTGHDYGDSPENDEAVRVIDRQVGQIYQAVQYREQNFDEEWLVIITTDHGRKAFEGKDHGGQSEREKTIWISTNYKYPNNYFYSSRPAIVDILPSIADFMGIQIPRKHQMELDGVSLVGEISISHPEAKLVGEELLVSWVAYHANEEVKIWKAETNVFNTSGDEDHYSLMGETDILKEVYRVPIKVKKGKLIKVVIEGKHNMLNRWVIR
jgi:predicted AlkP superfamily pyrophosphatase or phosphodiesterase